MLIFTFLTPHSSFITPHSSFRIHHSSFITHHSSLIIPLVAWLILAGLAVTASAQTNVTRIYIAPDNLTDYEYSATWQGNQQAFMDMINFYLAQADADTSNTSAYQSRWNMDCTMWVWTYRQNSTPAQFNRLIGRIKDGHFSVPLNTLVMCYGAQPLEAVLRGMYYAGQLERQYNLTIDMAVANENQTLPEGLGAVWAGAGAKYSWKGICDCATMDQSATDRDNDIYWWVGHDGSRLLTKWNSMLNGGPAGGYYFMGGYAEARYPNDVINYVETDPGFQAKYPYNVIGCFGEGGDNLETIPGDSNYSDFTEVAQSATTAASQVIVSNEEDFFNDFSATYGSVIPSQNCTYGNEWDSLSASMVEETASVKRAVEQLRGAESMASLVSLYQPAFMNGRQAARDLAWQSLALYFEENWTADGKTITRAQRGAWERQIAGQICPYVNTLEQDASTALAGLIANDGLQTYFYAFNPLSWTRTDYADLASASQSSVHVIDQATGSETPSQWVTVGGQLYLRVLAAAVPPVGYKVFAIVPGAGTTFTNGPAVSGNVLSNQYYQVTVDNRGAITSLIDLTRNNREFTATINNASGILMNINDLGPSTGAIGVENAGPVSVTLLTTASSPLQHNSRITLINNVNRIDIRNDINQNFGNTQTWGFSFALNQPTVHYEEIGDILLAKLQADGGNYSAHCARYDWITLNHFADMMDGSGQNVGVTLSNADLCFFQLGHSTPQSLDERTAQISPLAGGQVDGPGADGNLLGIPNQDGDTHFMQRFSLQTHDAYDPGQAMRFALEHQNPLVTAVLTGTAGPLPATTFSMLTIDNPDVLLWSLKPADDGTTVGLIARVWNVLAAPANFTLSAPSGNIAQAVQMNHLETPIGPISLNQGALTNQLTADQIQTYALTLQGIGPQTTEVTLNYLMFE